jgi:hypothetical protein
MTKLPFPLPNDDEIVEGSEATLEMILYSISHLSDEDCQKIVTLQKYHESLYMFGMGLPRYQFVRRPLPQTNA